MGPHTRARLTTILLLPALLAAACDGRSVPLVDGAQAHDGGADLQRDARAPDAGLTPTQQAVRACSIAASCSGALPPSWALAASARIDWFGMLDWPAAGYYAFGPSQLLAQRLLGCAKGPDCAAFHACFGGDWVHPGLCREDSVCSGKLLVPLNSPQPSFDCASVGGTCLDMPTGAARTCCTAPTSCSGGLTASCQGSKGTYCVAGIPFSFDCAPTNRICAPGSSNGGVCAGKGAACDVTSHTPGCAGAVATFCSAGKIATHDCSKNPYRSACTPMYSLPCGPAGVQCTAKFAGSCAGDELVSCLDGKLVNLDCRSIGFETCYAPTGGRPARCGYLLP